MDTCSSRPLTSTIIRDKGRERKKMELEVEVDVARAIGNLTFDTTETDAVFLLLAHLPGFKKDEIEVQIDEAKMEITVSGGGQIESFEYVNVDGLVNIGRVVEMGRFCNVFSVPDGVVFERIDATFDEEEEILLILIPRLGREIVVDQAEEEEVSCDVDKEASLEEQPEPIPIPLPDQSEEQGNEWEEEETPNEEMPDQMPNLPDSVENGNHDGEAEDPLNLVEGGDLQESESAQSPIISEESDEKLKEEDENPSFEAQDASPEEIEWPEMDMNFNLIMEQEEQDPETTRNRKSEESDSKCEDENPTIENEDPTRQTPEPIKLPETDTSFTLVEQQEPEITQNRKSEESNLDSTPEHENATIEAENPPPKMPESTKLPEIDMNFDQEPETIQNPRSEDPDQILKQDQDIPPQTSEPIKSPEIDTEFGPTQEQEGQEPESNQNTESKGPDQSFDGDDERRKRRRVSKRSPAFHLNATSLLAGSAFLFSLVVLVFHFLRGRKQSKSWK